MKRAYSFQELPKLLNPMAPASFLVSFTANSISHLIKTTKGKEKLLALAQYSAELLKLTMEDYVKKAGIIETPLHLINAVQVEKSMKNGRKLMRVLMFTDDLGAIERMHGKAEKFTLVDVLQLFLNLANIVYYLLDNLVWCADIGIISKFIAKANIRWKDTKDISSLARCIIGLLVSFITSFNTFDKIKSVKTQFIEAPKKVIKKNKKMHEKVCDLVNSRREYRFKVLDVIINILRFIMLAHSLQFPIFKRISKICISICGILSTSALIFNVLIGEQVVKVVQKKQSKSETPDVDSDL